MLKVSKKKKKTIAELFEEKIVRFSFPESSFLRTPCFCHCTLFLLKQDVVEHDTKREACVCMSMGGTGEGAQRI